MNLRFFSAELSKINIKINKININIKNIKFHIDIPNVKEYIVTNEGRQRNVKDHQSVSGLFRTVESDEAGVRELPDGHRESVRADEV